MDSVHSGEDYLDEEIFNPSEYMCIFPGCGTEGIYPKFNTKLVNWIHEELASGDFSGDRMADICAGPVVVPSILGSRVFKSIHLYEYTPQCRGALKSWKDGQSEAIDWTSFFHTVAQLEGHSRPDDIEARTRDAIKEILPIDLTDPCPLTSDTHFDFIYSTWTLEAVAKSEAEYKDLVSLIASWVRPGGGLLMVGSYGQSFYTLMEKKFHSLTLRESLVLSALDEAGFSVRRKSYFGVDLELLNPGFNSDCQGLFFISAVKKMN